MAMEKELERVAAEGRADTIGFMPSGFVPS